MNAMWPNELLFRRFSPGEVGELTGVEPPIQRLWSSRYEDFRSSTCNETEGKRWLWAGVQALMVFAEVMADTRDADLAQAVAIGEPGAALHCDQFGVYEFDMRSSEDGDLLVVKPFGEALWSGTTGVSSFARMFGLGDVNQRPRRCYVYNLSDMQRRLTAQLGVECI